MGSYFKDWPSIMPTKPFVDRRGGDSIQPYFGQVLDVLYDNGDFVGIIRVKIWGINQGKEDYGKVKTTEGEETDIIETYAEPADINIIKYPVPGEIVILTIGLRSRDDEDITTKTFYYTSVLSAGGNISYNGSPYYINTTKARTGLGTTSTDLRNAEEYKKRFEKVMKESKKFYESDKLKVRPVLRPYEGDMIIQSRWGSSIRFGSLGFEDNNQWSKKKSGLSGDPIMIISANSSTGNATSVEDVNTDDTSVYLCSSQTVPISIATSENLLSFSRVYNIPAKSVGTVILDKTAFQKPTPRPPEIWLTGNYYGDGAGSSNGGNNNSGGPITFTGDGGNIGNGTYTGNGDGKTYLEMFGPTSPYELLTWDLLAAREGYVNNYTWDCTCWRTGVGSHTLTAHWVNPDTYWNQKAVQTVGNRKLVVINTYNRDFIHDPKNPKKYNSDPFWWPWRWKSWIEGILEFRFIGDKKSDIDAQNRSMAGSNKGDVYGQRAKQRLKLDNVPERNECYTFGQYDSGWAGPIWHQDMSYKNPKSKWYQNVDFKGRYKDRQGSNNLKPNERTSISGPHIQSFNDANIDFARKIKVELFDGVKNMIKGVATVPIETIIQSLGPGTCAALTSIAYNGGPGALDNTVHTNLLPLEYQAMLGGRPLHKIAASGNKFATILAITAFSFKTQGGVGISQDRRQVEAAVALYDRMPANLKQFDTYAEGTSGSEVDNIRINLQSAITQAATQAGTIIRI